MLIELRQLLGEVFRTAAHFQCKQALFGCRRELRCRNRHKFMGRLLFIIRSCVFCPADIQFHRTIEDVLQLLGEAFRNHQRIQAVTAGKCGFTDELHGSCNTERCERITVRKCALGNIPDLLRKSDLFIMGRCRKRIWSDIDDGIRQHKTIWPHTARKTIHINDLQAVRHHNMHDSFQSGKCTRCDTAETAREENRLQNVFGLIRSQVNSLCSIGCDDRISLRNLEDMAAHLEFTDLFRRQDIVIFLKQFSDRYDLRLGEHTLLRPMELNLRTEHKIFRGSPFREILAQIYIRQTGTAGKCIRLDLGQRIRNLDCHQARTTPECLCFDTAHALRNFKPFTGFRFEECACRDHSILFQLRAPFLRAGQRFRNLMGKYTVVRAIERTLNRNKCHTRVKRIEFFFRFRCFFRTVRHFLKSLIHISLCIRNLADLFPYIGNCTDFFLNIRNRIHFLLDIGDRADLFLNLGNGIHFLLNLGNRIDILLTVGHCTDLLLQFRNCFDLLPDIGDRFDLLLHSGHCVYFLLDIGDRFNLLLHSGHRIYFLLDIGDRFNLLLHSGHRIDLLLNIGNRVNLILDTGNCFGTLLDSGDRLDLFLHRSLHRRNFFDAALHSHNALELAAHSGDIFVQCLNRRSIQRRLLRLGILLHSSGLLRQCRNLLLHLGKCFFHLHHRCCSRCFRKILCFLEGFSRHRQAHKLRLHFIHAECRTFTARFDKMNGRVGILTENAL